MVSSFWTRYYKKCLEILRWAPPPVCLYTYHYVHHLAHDQISQAFPLHFWCVIINCFVLKNNQLEYVFFHTHTHYLLSVWLRRLYRPRETPSPTETRMSKTAALRKREGSVVALPTGAVVMCCEEIIFKRLLLHMYKASPRYVSLQLTSVGLT